MGLELASCNLMKFPCMNALLTNTKVIKINQESNFNLMYFVGV